MRPSPWILALLLAPSLSRAQVTIVAPGSNQVPGSKTTTSNYGPPQVVELDAITMMPESYQRSHVIVEGDIEQRALDLWVLSRGSGTVLLLPGKEFDASQFGTQTAGKRMEIRGIVRRIREKQYVFRPQKTDLDLIEDPLLPVLPAPTLELPMISITVLAMRDRTSFDRIPEEQEIGSGIPRRILEEPAAYLGKTTKILGQFRGRNLFGDLPAKSARNKEDWVLKDGDGAVWVTGKAPKGEGWKLDLDYKGDSKTWLEVEGKPVVIDGVVYLKASRVIPQRAPGSERR